MNAVPARLHALHPGTYQQRAFLGGPLLTNDIMSIDDAPIRMTIEGDEVVSLQTPGRRIGIVGTYAPIVEGPSRNQSR
jgi:hypothetical protein